MGEHSQDIMVFVKAKDIDSLEQGYSKRELAAFAVDLYQQWQQEVDLSCLIDRQLENQQLEILADSYAQQASRERDRLRAEMDRLNDAYHYLEDERSERRERVDEMETLLAARPHQGGRRDKYTQEQRQAVIDFYQQDGETYVSTAKHFGMSTNTVGRILREQEEN